MPKAVDIYVLETKIGSGQFGDVFRGYSKVDGVDVAVKTIRREKIKGRHGFSQASSQSCSKTRYRSLRAAEITTSSGSSISRRQPTTSTSYSSIVMRAIYWPTSRPRRNCLSKKPLSTLCRFYMLFRH